MAPLGTVGTLGLFASPEAGVISLVAFLILSITLLALCARCQRKSVNEYDMNRTLGDVTVGANGNAGTKTAGIPNDSGVAANTSWRDHSNMPAATLERKTTFTT